MSSVIWSSSTAQYGCALGARRGAGSAGCRRDGRPGCGRGAAACRTSRSCVAGRLDGVERVAHGPVAERVEVRLEPERVEPDDVAAFRVSASMKSSPELSVAWPCDVEVGLEHRGGAVLDDPVAHELHARRRVAAEDAVRPPLDELVDLLEPSRAVPPQRADDARGELAGLGEREVRGLVRRLHPRVLPGGDAEAVQVALCLEQPARYSASSPRGQRADEVHRALVEGAERRAVGVAGDPAGDGVGGVRRDARRSSSAALLTHASWPSRLGRNTGRSGTTRSRSSRRGGPPGKSASDQPPPRIHSRSGWAAA